MNPLSGESEGKLVRPKASWVPYNPFGSWEPTISTFDTVSKAKPCFPGPHFGTIWDPAHLGPGNLGRGHLGPGGERNLRPMGPKNKFDPLQNWALGPKISPGPQIWPRAGRQNGPSAQKSIQKLALGPKRTQGPKSWRGLKPWLASWAGTQ